MPPEPRCTAPSPAAERLRAAFRPAEVIADRSQQHDGRVWATAFDIVRGVDVQEGRPVTVCWEDDTWTAEPHWDREELDWLWLTPAPEPAPGQDPDTSTCDPAADLAATAGLAVDQHRQARLLARAVLLQLGERAVPLLDDDLLTRLLQTARWPQPPARHHPGWTEGH